jgi:hypothetical protein
MWEQLLGGLDGNGNPVAAPCEIYFYGATGQKLETYSCLNSGGFSEALEGINIYFGGKLLRSKGVWVVVRQNSVGPTLKLISPDQGVGVGFRYRFPRCLRFVPEQHECGCAARERDRGTHW